MESLKKAAAAPAVLHPSKKIYYHLVSASSPLELSVWNSIYSADEDLKNNAFITQLNFSLSTAHWFKFFLNPFISEHYRMSFSGSQMETVWQAHVRCLAVDILALHIP